MTIVHKAAQVGFSTEASTYTQGARTIQAKYVYGLEMRWTSALDRRLLI